MKIRQVNELRECFNITINEESCVKDVAEMIARYWAEFRGIPFNEPRTHPTHEITSRSPRFIYEHPDINELQISPMGYEQRKLSKYFKVEALSEVPETLDKFLKFHEYLKSKV